MNKNFRLLQEKYTYMIEGSVPADPREPIIQTTIEGIYKYLIGIGVSPITLEDPVQFYKEMSKAIEDPDTLEYDDRDNDWRYLESTYVRKVMGMLKFAGVDFNKVSPSLYHYTLSPSVAYERLIRDMGKYPKNLIIAPYKKWLKYKNTVKKGSEEAGMDLDI